ncbi:SAM hydrolase/SAM-dependent halogenase family protein [Posidoniimonas polymericola]|nr:SAM-dependent chlorinase/fluorinase [Posidoniimonas polymericola]
MALITLTTDFGEGSYYVAAMKGVIARINPAAVVVDLTHSIPAQSIAAGAAALAAAAPWFPAGTIHVAVVDPGVGTDRQIVYVELGDWRFVLPNNGLLTRLASMYAASKMVVIENREHWLPEVSSTFHGRDIMAPVAAKLGLGLCPDSLGPDTLDKPTDKLILLPEPRAERVGDRIQGEVVEVDSFGNLITNITSVMLEGAPRDETLQIHCDGHQTMGLYSTYGDQPEMTLIALVGSTDRLELAIVNDSAAAMLGVRAGTPVEVSWG